jgi:hypothetical protein
LWPAIVAAALGAIAVAQLRAQQSATDVPALVNGHAFPLPTDFRECASRRPLSGY